MVVPAHVQRDRSDRRPLRAVTCCPAPAARHFPPRRLATGIRRDLRRATDPSPLTPAAGRPDGPRVIHPISPAYADNEPDRQIATRHRLPPPPVRTAIPPHRPHDAEQPSTPAPLTDLQSTASRCSATGTTRTPAWRTTPPVITNTVTTRTARRLSSLHRCVHNHFSIPSHPHRWPTTSPSSTATRSPHHLRRRICPRSGTTAACGEGQAPPPGRHSNNDPLANGTLAAAQHPGRSTANATTPVPDATSPDAGRPRLRT